MTDPEIDQALETAFAHQQAGRANDAEAIYRQVLAAKPRHPDAIYLLAVIVSRRGQIDSAIGMIQDAISIDPGMAEYHYSLGELYFRRKSTAAAIDSFEKAIELEPAFATAYFSLGLARAEKGDLDGAAAAYQKAVELAPDMASAHTNLGIVLKQLDRCEDAIAAYQKAIALKPDSFETHNNLGNALAHLRRFDEAIAAYQTAIRIKPDFLQGYQNLGNILMLAYRFSDAAAILTQAIKLKPDNSENWFALANALKDSGRNDESIAAYTNAIRLNPSDARPLANLSNALRHKGLLDDAIIASEKALSLDPNLVIAMNNLANLYKEQGRLDEALALLRRAISIEPDFVVAHSNLAYSVHFHPDYDAGMILAENKKWADTFEKPLQTQIHPHNNDRSKDRRLRIGYVSADFYRHPVGSLIAPVLAHHDPAKFELSCYSSVRRPDSFTDRLKKLAHTWRDVLTLTDEELANQIRQDKIDILIDLTMHMAGSRLLTFARKPAPVQVTYLGYVGTTGLNSIDYRLSDARLDPPEQGDQHYSEKTIRLPASYWCYPTPEESPQVSALPASRAGHVTFACFNNFFKITTPTLQTWIELLKSIPTARLMLFCNPGSHRQPFLQRFAAAGIDLSRIALTERAPLRQYFEQYNAVDIALDPFPYSGGTTTCDALWMGVPTITLAGRTGVGRGGVTLLTSVGLEDWIATDTVQYLSIAHRWANDLPALANLRATLRQKMQQSRLMDAPRFTADIENAFRQMWQTWCASK